MHDSPVHCSLHVHLHTVPSDVTDVARLLQCTDTLHCVHAGGPKYPLAHVLQSVGSNRAGHDWQLPPTHPSLHVHTHPPPATGSTLSPRPLQCVSTLHSPHDGYVPAAPAAHFEHVSWS